MTGFVNPRLPLDDTKPRAQRVCADCGKRRLTTLCHGGPLCNDCLAA